MNKKQIKNILEDIYKIDTNLKAYGSQLEKIVMEILKAKPEVIIDKKFKQELYQEIMTKISELKPKKESIWQGLFNRKFSYAFAGASTIIVILVVVFFFVPNDRDVSFNLGIEDVADNHFGLLTISDQGTSLLQETEGIGGRGGGGMPSADGSIRVPAPGYTEYKYVYVGDDFSIEEGVAGVYKRKIDSAVSKAFAKKVSSLNFNFINFSKFNDLSVENITIVEDHEFGYSINLDFRNAFFGIYRNWQQWPQEEQIKVSNIPSDEEIIAIANDFIKKHGIDMNSYADGEVSSNWNAMLLEQITNQWVPIMYQLLLDGKGVYDEWGNKVGIYAEVDIVNKKLSNLSNVAVQSYDRSNYAMETDVNRILEIVLGGSYLGPIPRQEPIKIIEIELGTPEKVFVQVYLQNRDQGQSEILYAPALSFPIIDSDTIAPYGRKKIVIPIVKEILDQREKNNLKFILLSIF